MILHKSRKKELTKLKLQWPNNTSFTFSLLIKKETMKYQWGLGRATCHVHPAEQRWAAAYKSCWISACSFGWWPISWNIRINRGDVNQKHKRVSSAVLLRAADHSLRSRVWTPCAVPFFKNCLTWWWIFSLF
jgi:hypothetical protein